MAVYGVGGEADCFYPVSGQTYAFEATGGGAAPGSSLFINTLSRGAMKVEQGVSELELNASANVALGYIHAYLYQETVAGTVADWIQIKQINGNPSYRIGLNPAGTWTIQRYSGGGYITMGTSTSSIISNEGAYIDMFIKVDPAVGEFRVFKDGTEVFTFSGNTNIDNATFGRIHFKGQSGTANELNVSQIIFSNESTLGWVLATLNPDGNGFNTAWTGSYTDIDEFVLDTNDYIEAIAVNLVETSTVTNINGAYSTYNVKAVVVAMRASNDTGSVIADLQAAIRTASTNYFSPNLSLPKDGTDYSRQYVWDVNPNTAAAWSQASVNAIEVGVKSV